MNEIRYYYLSKLLGYVRRQNDTLSYSAIQRAEAGKANYTNHRRDFGKLIVSIVRLRGQVYARV